MDPANHFAGIVYYLYWNPVSSVDRYSIDTSVKAMRTVLVYRAVTKYVTLKNTLVYKI